VTPEPEPAAPELELAPAEAELAMPEPAWEPVLEPEAAIPDDASEPPEPLRVAAVHLGGVADLSAGERDIELSLSEHGLDIVRGTDEILGRLRWDEIRALDVASATRRARGRRRDQKATLVIRTGHGEASFDVPAISPQELREHLAPLVSRYGRL
jgi:hypothetical protein